MMENSKVKECCLKIEIDNNGEFKVSYDGDPNNTAAAILTAMEDDARFKSIVLSATVCHLSTLPDEELGHIMNILFNEKEKRKYIQEKQWEKPVFTIKKKDK